MSDPAWTYGVRADGVGELLLDLPGRSANVLGSAVLRELGTVLDVIERQPPTGVVIRSGKPGGFIAGADINEFTTLRSVGEALALVQLGQGLCDRIAALPCPTVALVQGFAFGGGLELALACRYRVGVDDGRLALGLPEVQLGIHPGFGGTVRSVQLLGAATAMDLMLTGRTVRSEKALKIGLIDRHVKPADVESACRELIARRPAPHRPPLKERMISWPVVRGFASLTMERKVAARARPEHYPAPYALIRLWRKHGASGRAAYRAEAASIAGLFVTPTARNLVRVYQLQERLKSLGSKDAAAASAPRISRVHVVGAGVMGGDIAAWCALRGLSVTLQDQAIERVQPALQRATELFAKRLPVVAEREAALGRLVADVPGDGIAAADLVIEAIFENREAKRALYAATEPRMKPGALLATNTSSLVLESLDDALADAGRFVGLHFFNPVPQMPLVEIIAGPHTRPEVAAAAAVFVRRLDKLPLPCRSAPGFLINRLLIPYMQEGLIAIEEGIAPEIVDGAAVHFGMPMGPVELADVVGLDVCRQVGQIITAAVGRRIPVALKRLDALIAMNHLGRKSGQGFYRWEDGKAQKQQVEPDFVARELQDRLMLTLVNESVACLRLGVVADADLVDAGVIFGTGFAPFRGGPLHWARETGPETLKKRLQQLALQHGSRFEPDPGWSLL
jgi:3-hydroxyacyl-CoA dehydrogenase / enoyl-CoA hydratase / 3-hydroxybutyryl-CoA epimerase